MKNIFRRRSEDEVYEIIAPFVKDGAKNDIAKLTEAFHENNESDIRKYVLRLMSGLGSEKSFKKDPDKLIKSYQFTDEELQSITGRENPKDARAALKNVVNELLEDGTYGVEDISREFDLFLLLS